MKVLALGSEHVICALSFCAGGFCALSLAPQAGPVRYNAGHDPAKRTNWENLGTPKCSLLQEARSNAFQKYRIQSFKNTACALPNPRLGWGRVFSWLREAHPPPSGYSLLVTEKWNSVHFQGPAIRSSHAFSKYLLSTFQVPGTAQMLRVRDLIGW